MDKKKNKYYVYFGVFIVALFLLSGFIGSFTTDIYNSIVDTSDKIVVLSSYENKSVSDEVQGYALSIGNKVEFKFMGDLEIVDELNNNSKEYDAVWISNSMWLYMLDNTYLTSDSKSISISPVVFGIRKSKARELNLINGNVTNTTVLNLIKDKKIKYVMSSVTQTNTGATAYLGFLSSLAGNPEVLTEEMIKDDKLNNDLISIFSGVERVSGDEDYLEEMFLNSDDYEAVIASESSLININKSLAKKNKEPLYLIYPSDGVAINDSTFAFISNDPEKEDTFLSVQSYLLSDEGRGILEDNGVRTWYGGVTDNSNNKVFNSDWGIKTNEYLNVTKFPSKKVITAAINLYIEKLRKPTHVVFCLDYSGSMYGEGVDELKEAMNYILDYDKASRDKLQFSKFDKVTIIPFSSKVRNVWTTDNGIETSELINNINNEEPTGATALYDAIERGLNILSKEDDSYTKTIISMTDGRINVGSYDSLKRNYNKLKSDVPIYSITFGSAVESELEEIAGLSNAKVFDGRTNLLRAFKEVRSYN